MQVEEFIETYSTVYMFMFEKEEKQIEKEIKKVKKNTISMISEFLFEPRYEVKNLRFKLLG